MAFQHSLRNSDLPIKEVIQGHLPVPLPCYDFVPVINPTFDGSLLSVKIPTSGVANSHDTSLLMFPNTIYIPGQPSFEDLPVPYTTQKPSIISTGLLNTLLYFHLRPIQQVVSLRSYTFQSRELILKRVSHLDAFSGYLSRTWLLSGAPGGTTCVFSIHLTV